MISFSCPQCKTTYRFAETRAGEKLACSKCKNPIQIPLAGSPAIPPLPTGPRPAAPPPLPRVPTAPASPGPRPPAPPPLPTRAPVPPTSIVTGHDPRPVAPPVPPRPPANPVATAPRPPAPPPAPEPAKPQPARKAKQWYYEARGDVVGPVPEKELRVAAETNALAPDGRVWAEGMTDWQPVIKLFPRVFDGLPSKPRLDTQKKVAAGLAALALLSLVTLGCAYLFKGGKSAEPVKQEVAKNDPPPAAPPPAPTPAATAERLNPAQIMARCGPSVARVSAGSGTGSGFLARPNIVVTNAHVVEGGLSTQFRVSFPSGPRPAEMLPATLLYEDSGRDLAILEVRTDLPPLKLASDAVKGEEVAVIGSPGTEPGKTADNSITRGILSAMNEEVFGHGFHRIDAAINPGNSGGPVFNDRGAVLGVATMHLRDKQQMNYIVPFADVATAVERVKDVSATDTAALAKRHDARVVATRLMVGVLLNDTIQSVYAERIVEAVKQKRDPLPALRAVKKALLADVQARVDYVAPAEVREAAQRLAGTGAGAADAAARDDLRKLLRLFDDSQRLAANVEDYTLSGYLERHQETTTRFNELFKSLPKSAGENEDRFGQRVGALYERAKK